MGLQTARDLLLKLRMDRERLVEKSTPDRFFNFVVTAFHLTDSVDADPSVPSSAQAVAAFDTGPQRPHRSVAHVAVQSLNGKRLAALHR